MRAHETATGTHLSRLAISAVLACSGVAGLASGKDPRAGWSRYCNDRWGFCVSYPASWEKLEGLDQSGIGVYPHKIRDLNSATRISVGGLPNQLKEITEGPPRTLDDNFHEQLAGLVEVGKAQDIRVLEERREEFLGYPAMRTKIQYWDPKNRLAWIEETFWVNHNQVIFTFELRCQPQELATLHPVLNGMIRTFQFDCKAKE